MNFKLVFRNPNNVIETRTYKQKKHLRDAFLREVGRGCNFAQAYEINPGADKVIGTFQGF